MSSGFIYLTFLLVTSTLFAFISIGSTQQPIIPEEACIGCICEAASDCNRTLGCNGDVCGLFRITWAYWADSGRPVIENDDPTSAEAFQNCVTEPYCAARSVIGYIARFGKDCNGDGVISCYDHGRLHHLGAYGCANNQPNPAYDKALRECIDEVGKLAGKPI